MLPAVTPEHHRRHHLHETAEEVGRRILVRLARFVRRGQRRGEVFEQGPIRLDRLMSPERTGDGQRFERASAA